MTEDIKLPELGELTFPQWQAWLAKYDAVLGKRDRRITQLEDALKELLSLGEWGLNDLARTVAREALEGKEGA
jgi:hypothetical protein